jgi:hypothetical protein
MLVGGAYLFCGIFIIVRLIDVRKAELHVWGSADWHFIGFFFGICLIGIGAFVVHVGVIYYSRKLYGWASTRSRSRRHGLPPDQRA